MADGVVRPDAVLAVWRHTVEPCAGDRAATAWVPPDGCQDLIGIALPGAAVQWHVFALAPQATDIPLVPGTRLWGYRLCPGTQVNIPALLNAMACVEGEDEHRALQWIGQTCHHSNPVQQSLEALAQAPSVADAARALGVSERTLQRLVRAHTGQSPAFWKGLARLRQSAHSLAQAQFSLPDVAALHGYCDQAHMNLAFRHWLGCSPGQLRRNPERLALLQADGYT